METYYKNAPQKLEIIIKYFKDIKFDDNIKISDIGGISSYYKILETIFKNGDIYLLNINRSDIIGVKSIVGDAYQLPFKDETLNIITSFDSIEHLVNVDDFLKESFRVLNVSGSLIISTPNLADFYSRITFLLGYTPFSYNPSKFRVAVPFSKVETNMGHKSVFTYKGLKELLTIHGFNIVGSYSYSYIDSFYFENDLEKMKNEVGFYNVRKMLDRILPKSMGEGMLFICNKV